MPFGQRQSISPDVGSSSLASLAPLNPSGDSSGCNSGRRGSGLPQCVRPATTTGLSSQPSGLPIAGPSGTPARLLLPFSGGAGSSGGDLARRGGMQQRVIPATITGQRMTSQPSGSGTSDSQPITSPSQIPARIPDNRPNPMPVTSDDFRSPRYCDMRQPIGTSEYSTISAFSQMSRRSRSNVDVDNGGTGHNSVTVAA